MKNLSNRIPNINASCIQNNLSWR